MMNVDDIMTRVRAMLGAWPFATQARKDAELEELRAALAATSAPAEALTPEYAEAVRKLAEQQDMSEVNVLRAAIRLYQAERNGTATVEFKRETSMLPAPSAAQPGSTEHAQIEEALAAAGHDVKVLRTLPKGDAAQPEPKCSPTLTECPRRHNNVQMCDGAFAAQPEAGLCQDEPGHEPRQLSKWFAGQPDARRVVRDAAIRTLLAFDEWQARHGPNGGAYDIEHQRAGWDGALRQVAEALATSATAEPAAWMYRLAGPARSNGEIKDWSAELDFSKPKWSPHLVRDITPLYAAPQPAPAVPEDALQQMEQRKDAAYLERNRVVAALATAFPSGVARTAIEGWSEDWHGCVYIDLPTGQASWHFHDSQAYLFDGLPPYAGQWDGHSTEEKYERLARLTPAVPQPEAPAEPSAENTVELLQEMWDLLDASGRVPAQAMRKFSQALSRVEALTTPPAAVVPAEPPMIYAMGFCASASKAAPAAEPMEAIHGIENEATDEAILDALDGLHQHLTKTGRTNGAMVGRLWSLAAYRFAFATGAASVTTPAAVVVVPAELSDALQCLRDLVCLKDMKERLERLHEMGHGTDWDYYHKNKPATWERARAILAASKEKAS